MGIELVWLPVWEKYKHSWNREKNDVKGDRIKGPRRCDDKERQLVTDSQDL